MFRDSTIFSEICSSGLLCFIAQSFLANPVYLIYYVLCPNSTPVFSHPRILRTSRFTTPSSHYGMWLKLGGALGGAIRGWLQTVTVLSHPRIVLWIKPNKTGIRGQGPIAWSGGSDYSILLCVAHRSFLANPFARFTISYPSIMFSGTGPSDLICFTPHLPSIGFSEPVHLIYYV